MAAADGGFFMDGDDFGDDLDLDGVDEVFIEGPEGLTRMFGNMSGARDDRSFLAHLGSGRVTHDAKLNPALRGTVARLTRIGRSLHQFEARREALELERPNQWVGVFTAGIAPLGATTITIAPAAGQPAWKFMGLTGTDDQAEDFAMSALVIAGMPMILAGTQTPAAPVANACPLTNVMIRESSHTYHLAPWVGREFDNQTNCSFTIVNATNLGDAITRSCRLSIPVQADPCGQSQAAVKSNAQLLTRTSKRLRRVAAMIR